MTNDSKRQIMETEKLLNQIRQLVQNSYSNVLSDSNVKKQIEAKNDSFTFSGNDSANKGASKVLGNMAKQLNSVLLNGIEREWMQGESRDWETIRKTHAKTESENSAFDKIREQATQSAKEKTAKAYYNEKRNGFSISDRVWNLAGNAKKEIEIIIQNGIKEGKSADDIQKSLKGYLNEPDKLFKRVRNKETGELELSKAAQKYKPGQGVYRSAYKNAMRLARTELKAANCEAVWQSAQANPLITGWQIVLSNNHTTLVNGVPLPFKDICDTLQGTYPKTFKFKGWHPQCRCEMLPITINQEDRKSLYKSIFDGKRDEWKPEQITEMPEQFTKWIDDNKSRMTESSRTPYFVRDNFINGDIESGLNIKIKKTKRIKTEQQKADIQARWDERKAKQSMQENLHEVIKIMDDAKVEYRDVQNLANNLTETEIVERLAGGDLTKGSCSSLAFAYAGNKCGFDVLDFRDGTSRSNFSRSSTINDIANRVGGSVVQNTSDFVKANKLLEQVKPGKEYYFTCGKHAAIVRKTATGGYEYLELQSSKINGFKELNKNVLKSRFGAQQSHKSYGVSYETKDCIIDIDLLKKDTTFRKLLGYINTQADKQRKGVKGTIK